MAGEWADSELGNLVRLQRGHDLTDSQRKPGTVPVMGSAGQNGFHDTSKAKGPGIVLGRSGASFGKVHYTPDDYWPHNTALYVTDFQENDELFTYYFLKTIDFTSYNTGSAQPSLNRNHLYSITVNIPPLPEQKAIAHVLGSLDDKIELNRRMNETLEGMAQVLFKSWFVDFDPVIDNALAAGNPIPEPLAQRTETRRQALANGTANRESAKAFPDSFYFTEELGWIPDGWEVKAVSDALQINPSLKLSKGTVAPFADMKALPTSGYAIDGVIEKAYSGGAKFQNGDVLLARITPCLENGKTGIVNFLTDSDPVGFGSTEFIVLRDAGDLSTAFIASLARDSNFRKHCVQSMIGSSGRQRVHNSCFERYYLALPKDRDVVVNFNGIAVPAFAKADRQSNENRILAKLRDTLLPKLISGELRIPQAEKMVEEALL